MNNFQKTSKEISFLINSAIGCAKIKKLIIEENEKDYTMRSSLHILLQSPIGQAKSTILSQIGNETSQPIITEVTRAGLVGSLDNKTLQPIPGAAWESRNSLMLLDEFTLGKKKEGWEVFLQLLESQTWGKRIGIFSADSEITDEDLFFKAKKGRIDMKTRFSCIIATMKKFEYHRGQTFRAFLTRCIPFVFNLEINDLNEISEGKELFKKKELNPPKEFIIKNRPYNTIKKKVWNSLKSCPNELVQKEIFLRAIGDCCRIYAANQKNSNEHIKNIVKWKIDAQSRIGLYFRGKI